MSITEIIRQVFKISTIVAVLAFLQGCVKIKIKDPIPQPETVEEIVVEDNVTFGGAGPTKVIQGQQEQAANELKGDGKTLIVPKTDANVSPN